jgi:replication factor C subunit 3/5
LQDIIQGIYDFAQTVEFSSATRVYFLDQIAQVEYVSPRFVLPRAPG